MVELVPGETIPAWLLVAAESQLLLETVAEGAATVLQQPKPPTYF